MCVCVWPTVRPLPQGVRGSAQLQPLPLPRDELSTRTHTTYTYTGVRGSAQLQPLPLPRDELPYASLQVTSRVKLGTKNRVRGY